jgi:hypothetical protein
MFSGILVSTPAQQARPDFPYTRVPFNRGT